MKKVATITPEQELFLDRKIMEEIGLEVNNGKIMDQDYGAYIQFKGKQVLAPGAYPSKNYVVFDPYNSTTLMIHLFDLFCKKYEYDTGVSIGYTYQTECGVNGSSITAVMSNQKSYTSAVYKRDTLRYMDIILQLNGDENPFSFLKQFDIPRSVVRNNRR